MMLLHAETCPEPCYPEHKQLRPPEALMVRGLPGHFVERRGRAWDSIQSHSALMYSGAVSRIGFTTLTPSAHRYSYCRGANQQSRSTLAFHPPMAW